MPKNRYSSAHFLSQSSLTRTPLYDYDHQDVYVRSPASSSGTTSRNRSNEHVIQTYGLPSDTRVRDFASTGIRRSSSLRESNEYKAIDRGNTTDVGVFLYDQMSMENSRLVYDDYSFRQHSSPQSSSQACESDFDSPYIQPETALNKTIVEMSSDEDPRFTMSSGDLDRSKREPYQNSSLRSNNLLPVLEEYPRESFDLPRAPRYRSQLAILVSEQALQESPTRSTFEPVPTNRISNNPRSATNLINKQLGLSLYHDYMKACSQSDSDRQTLREDPPDQREDQNELHYAAERTQAPLDTVTHTKSMNLTAENLDSNSAMALYSNRMRRRRNSFPPRSRRVDSDTESFMLPLSSVLQAGESQVKRDSFIGTLPINSQHSGRPIIQPIKFHNHQLPLTPPLTAHASSSGPPSPALSVTTQIHDPLPPLSSPVGRVKACPEISPRKSSLRLSKQSKKFQRVNLSTASRGKRSSTVREDDGEQVAVSGTTEDLATFSWLNTSKSRPISAVLPKEQRRHSDSSSSLSSLSFSFSTLSDQHAAALTEFHGREAFELAATASLVKKESEAGTSTPGKKRKMSFSRPNTAQTSAPSSHNNSRKPSIVTSRPPPPTPPAIPHLDSSAIEDDSPVGPDLKAPSNPDFEFSFDMDRIGLNITSQPEKVSSSSIPKFKHKSKLPHPSTSTTTTTKQSLTAKTTLPPTKKHSLHRSLSLPNALSLPNPLSRISFSSSSSSSSSISLPLSISDNNSDKSSNEALPPPIPITRSKPQVRHLYPAPWINENQSPMADDGAGSTMSKTSRLSRLSRISRLSWSSRATTGRFWGKALNNGGGSGSGNGIGRMALFGEDTDRRNKNKTKTKRESRSMGWMGATWFRDDNDEDMLDPVERAGSRHDRGIGVTTVISAGATSASASDPATAATVATIGSQSVKRTPSKNKHGSSNRSGPGTGRERELEHEHQQETLTRLEEQIGRIAGTPHAKNNRSAKERAEALSRQKSLGKNSVRRMVSGLKRVLKGV